MARRIKGKKSGLLGVNDLNKKLRKMGPAVTKGMKPVMMQVANAIYTDALKRVRVREGDLALSLKKQVRPNGLSSRVGYWKAGNKKNWELAGWRAHFIEFGTENTKPFPFLRPAFKENISFAKKKIDKRVDVILRKISNG